MNYPMFALLAIMFIAYVFLKRSNKRKRCNSGDQQDQKLKELEEEIKKLKGRES